MLAYQRYDVVTDQPFGGNQLAVFINPGELATETMQAIAREFNLAEITFVTPAEKPENHYRVRIFTPTTEMPTAGHPTIGTAYALVIHAMASLPAAYVVAISNGGIVIAALLSVFWFRETEHRWARLTWAAVLAVGLGLVSLA